jgi:hypothetical protein
MSERELLENQIKIYEFYAGLIGRAVHSGASASAKLPKWDEQRAEEYKRLADELRARLATLPAQEADAPATVPGVTTSASGPTSGSDSESTAS